MKRVIGNFKDRKGLEQTLENLAEFLDVTIAYQDEGGLRESITLYKGEKKFVIRASGNRYDGGFFSFPTRNQEEDYGPERVYGPEPGQVSGPLSRSWQGL